MLLSHFPSSSSSSADVQWRLSFPIEFQSHWKDIRCQSSRLVPFLSDYVIAFLRQMFGSSNQLPVYSLKYQFLVSSEWVSVVLGSVMSEALSTETVNHRATVGATGLQHHRPSLDNDAHDATVTCPSTLWGVSEHGMRRCCYCVRGTQTQKAMGFFFNYET